jgi:hypothetical protein
MDIKRAFLNGHFEEDIYMVQPGGFVAKKQEQKVCKLQKSIYGLKQTSRSWNIHFDLAIKSFGFCQKTDESCVYMKSEGGRVVFSGFICRRHPPPRERHRNVVNNKSLVGQDC